MQHPFEVLSPEYAHRWSVMKVTRPQAAIAAAKSLLINRAAYDACQAATGVPSGWLMCVNERESDGDLRTYLGNGDPLNQITTHVPAGRGPFADWQSGAIDALRYDRIDQVKGWSIPRKFFEDELWNGFGPRNHGIATGYIWAGTDQYTQGKYVADGVWDPTVQDQQLGTAAVFWALLQLSPSLGAPFGDAAPPLVAPHVLPIPSPMGLHDTEWLQRSLNLLGTSPKLVADGSFGRKTKAAVVMFQIAHGLSVDGFAGPETIPAIEAALAALPATAALAA